MRRQSADSAATWMYFVTYVHVCCVVPIMTMNTEKLIANVYQRRSLWDKTDRMYHNRDFARDKWHEVCVELGLQKTGNSFIFVLSITPSYVI